LSQRARSRDCAASCNAARNIPTGVHRAALRASRRGHEPAGPPPAGPGRRSPGRPILVSVPMPAGNLNLAPGGLAASLAHGRLGGYSGGGLARFRQADSEAGASFSTGKCRGASSSSLPLWQWPPRAKGQLNPVRIPRAMVANGARRTSPQRGGPPELGLVTPKAGAHPAQSCSADAPLAAAAARLPGAGPQLKLKSAQRALMMLPCWNGISLSVLRSS
jgi:hypothetical protein